MSYIPTQQPNQVLELIRIPKGSSNGLLAAFSSNLGSHNIAHPTCGAITNKVNNVFQFQSDLLNLNHDSILNQLVSNLRSWNIYSFRFSTPSIT